MTTAEFERIAKEFGKLKYWKHALNEIREMRKKPDYWSVKFHNTFSDLEIAFPCVPISDMLERIEDNITDEYKKQKQICDSISLPYELKNP